MPESGEPSQAVERLADIRTRQGASSGNVVFDFEQRDGGNEQGASSEAWLRGVEERRRSFAMSPQVAFSRRCLGRTPRHCMVTNGSTGVLRSSLDWARDFACGLTRPHDGSTSTLPRSYCREVPLRMTAVKRCRIPASVRMTEVMYSRLDDMGKRLRCSEIQCSEI